MAKHQGNLALGKSLDDHGWARLEAAVTACVVAVAACQDVAVTAVAVGSVELTPESATIVIEETREFSAIVTDDAGNELTGRTVVWSSEDRDVADVDDAGVVTAIGVGATRIAATSEGRTGHATIAVMPKPVGSVTIEPDELTLLEDGRQTVRAEVRTEDGTELIDREVSWTSSDDAIVEVNPRGPNGLEANVRAGRCPRGEVRCTAEVVATAEGLADTATVDVSKVATAVSISPAVLDTLDPSETVQLTAHPTADGGATDLSETRRVVWAISPGGIAQLNPTEGVTTTVNGIDPTCDDGPVCLAGITAEVDGVTDQVNVHVRKAVATVIVAPSSVTFSPPFLPHQQTFTATLVAKDDAVLPGRSITWKATSPTDRDSPCGEGSGPAQVSLNPTTGTSTTATVAPPIGRSVVLIWAEAEGVVGCATLQIAPVVGEA